MRLTNAFSNRYKAGLKEAQILQKLRAMDQEDKKHVVKLERTFEHRGHLCLVFESLRYVLCPVFYAPFPALPIVVGFPTLLSFHPREGGNDFPAILYFFDFTFPFRSCRHRLLLVFSFLAFDEMSSDCFLYSLVA